QRTSSSTKEKFVLRRSRSGRSPADALFRGGTSSSSGGQAPLRSRSLLRRRSRGSGEELLRSGEGGRTLAPREHPGDAPHPGAPFGEGVHPGVCPPASDLLA